MDDRIYSLAIGRYVDHDHAEAKEGASYHRSHPVYPLIPAGEGEDEQCYGKREGAQHHWIQSSLWREATGRRSRV